MPVLNTTYLVHYLFLYSKTSKYIIDHYLMYIINEYKMYIFIFNYIFDELQLQLNKNI